MADSGGTLLWVDEARELDAVPTDLSCVGCGVELVWRHGEVNQPHFAHKGGGGCGGETALHKLTIEVISRSILAAAATGDVYPLEVPCRECEVTKLGNLAKHRGLCIVRDRVLDAGIRPDICALDSDGAPLFVIEVVVSHAPEPGAIAVYENLRIPCITVFAGWDHLAGLRTGFSSERIATSKRLAMVGQDGMYMVDGFRCTSARHFAEPVRSCSQCQATAVRHVAVELAASHCHVCKVPTATLDFVDHVPLRLRRIAAGCPDLVGVEQVAATYGIDLRRVHSSAAGGSYLAHHCRNGHFQGDNFIYRSEGHLDLSRPVQHMVVCSKGHWEKRGEPRPWRADLSAERVGPVVGLVGEPAGVFSGRSSPRRQPGMSGREVARFMAFGSSGW